MQATSTGSRTRRGGRNDHHAARALAESAGMLLLEIRSRLAEGMAAEDVRLEGDRRSHELLVALLQREFPDDAVLSEEGAGQTRGFNERVWIIDPLDGTREFGEFGREDWAVHVALVERGELHAGAVSLPARVAPS